MNAFSELAKAQLNEVYAANDSKEVLEKRELADTYKKYTQRSMAAMDLRAKLNRAIAAKAAADQTRKERLDMEVKLARAERLFEQVCDDVDHFLANPSVARDLGP